MRYMNLDCRTRKVNELLKDIQIIVRVFMKILYSKSQ